MLILSLAGMASIDAKCQRLYGNQWERFANVTSRMPFLAVLQGRNTFRFREIGWRHIVFALVIFAVTVSFHRSLFGVSALP